MNKSVIGSAIATKDLKREGTHYCHDIILSFNEETAEKLTLSSGLSIVVLNKINHTFLRDCEP